jgi:hypothetical protein
MPATPGTPVESATSANTPVRAFRVGRPVQSRIPFVGAGLVRVTLVLAGLLAGQVSAPAAEQSDGGTAEDLDFFEQRIRPLLVNHCAECHGGAGEKTHGGLSLDTRAGWETGGDSGPAIVPGDPDASLLIRAVRYADTALQMPPDGKLSAEQIADLERWVRRGAADPRTGRRAAPGIGGDEARQFWSFLPVREPPLPEVRDSGWPLSPVDHFMLARMEQAGVRPAPPADRRTLLRRLTFDLTGLPPTPEEMEAFLADPSSQAFERVVDRLLASPRYGEHWGRHWLDVVRYSDSSGNASDYPVPQAHKYRDWVIAAFNRDLPYDRFVREQLAGDLLPGGTAEERYDRIVATGYLAIARRFGGSRTGEFHLTIEDVIDNLGKAFLGSSISCARCHDHKFDPFTMRDYYGLYGVFSSTRFPFPGAEVGRRQEDFVPLMPPEEVERLLRPHREQVAALEAEVKRLETAEADAKKSEADDKKAAVTAAAKALADGRKKLADAQKNPPVLNAAYAVAEGSPANARLQLRGDPKRPGDEVPRRFPEVLGGRELPPETSTSGRLELAEWIVAPDNPLTARVMVNRIWHHHFGRGLVPTPNDFGRRGQPPTHPELLDFLAARFVRDGWSVKSMHRLIVLSRTWQMASEIAAPDGPAVADLYGRFSRRRLSAEEVRDALLFVSGNLDETSPGAHPFPEQHTWNWTQHGPFVALYPSRRRSVYLMQQRLRKHPFLALFDGADPSASTAARVPTTTPLQALFIMNDELAHTAASGLAARASAAAPDDAARITVAWRLAVARDPDAEELEQCLQFLDAYRAAVAANEPGGDRDAQAWSALGRSLLGMNEFVFVD